MPARKSDTQGSVPTSMVNTTTPAPAITTAASEPGRRRSFSTTTPMTTLTSGLMK